MKRIYLNNKLRENLIYSLDYNQSIHLSKSIRLKFNDKVIIFNNYDGEWLAVIENINKKKEISVKCLVKISDPKNIPNIDLCFSPIKYKNSETIIRQSTELGIRNLYPTLFKRTVLKTINEKKFDAYAIGAVQQSGRTQIPIIKKMTKLKDQKANLVKKNIFMFDENLDGLDISKIEIDKNKDICVIIGPEGGFIDEERDLLKSFSKNFYNLKLGSRIFKADTAVVSALTLVFHYFDTE